MRTTKALLIILIFGLFGCATTGATSCDEKTIGKYRCHWWYGLEQCVKSESAETYFAKIETKCDLTFEAQCGWREKQDCCEKYRCALDGSAYGCEKWCGCECDLEKHPEVKNLETRSPVEEVDWSRIIR